MSPKVKELIERCFPIAEDDHIELPNGASLHDILQNELPEIMEEYARFRVDLCCKIPKKQEQK